MKANTPMAGIIDYAKANPQELLHYERVGICPECKNLQSVVEMVLCPHESYVNPVWKDSLKGQQLKKMMSSVQGGETAYMVYK